MANRSNRSKLDPAAEVCRTCMDGSMNPVGRTKRNRKMVPIFTKVEDAFIANIITDCTGVEITENDGLPAVICTGCFKTVTLLVTFIQSTRDCDAKLRQLCKVEILEEKKEEPTQEDDGEGGSPSEKTEVTGATHFLEIKCEPVDETMGDDTVEHAALESDEAEPDNDTDSDWKGSGDDEEEYKEERKVKRQRLGLKSKPKPRKVGGNAKHKIKRTPRIPSQYIQSKDDLKLNEKEQELFTTIEVPPDSHVCCGCLHIFNSPEELETHRKMTHVWKRQKKVKEMPTKLVCDGCLRRYVSTKQLNYHFECIRRLKAVWECIKCKIRFKVAVKRQQHAKSHAEDAPDSAVIARIPEPSVQEFGWSCCGKKCSASFSTKKELIAHGLESHWIEKQKADLEAAEKPEQCQICFARLIDMKAVARHQKRPYRQAKFQCSLCGLKFILQDQLNAHETKEHGISVFQCQICDKNFTMKSSLASHMDNIHSDAKPHQCTVCGMAFKQKTNLRTHMSKHIEVRQFKCEVCSKMFKVERHLQYHMRTHTGEKPYKCRICNHAFANHTNCRRHEMTHSGDRPHKCSHCEKSFILRRTLLEHESTHTGLTSTRPKVIRSKAKPQQKSESIKLMEVEVDDDDDDVDEASSNDTSYNQTLSMAGNRPVTISVARPTASSQAVNAVRQSSPHLASNIGIQSAPVSTVYNIIPSTSGNAYEYILKF